MANSRRAASGDPVCAGIRAASAMAPGPSGAGSEAPRLVGDVVEIEKAAAFADDVEQIAVLAGGGVGPFAGRPLRPTP